MEEVVATEEEWKAARAKAVAGAEFLTSYFGDTSWTEGIDVRVLDMGLSDACVLGQLGTCGCPEPYGCMQESLGIGDCEEAARYGFWAQTPAEYRLLTAVWREWLSV